MSNDHGYNGWKNYETWVTALWIDNEQGSYSESRMMAAEAVEEAEANLRTAEGLLADRLKEWVEETRPEVEGYWADMLGAAFSEVDWYEIAENYLSEQVGA